MKIMLELIEEPVAGICALTGEKVEYNQGYGFFVEGKLNKPVAEAVALEQGFTVNKKTLAKLVALIDEGRKYEEVQKAAHEEFKTLK